jgi:hypothetical protein
MMEAQTWEVGFGSITGLEHQEFPVAMHDGLVPKRLQSHDCGMVGFIKALVDLAGENNIRATIAAPLTRTHRIRSLEICFGIAIAEKA